MSVLVWNSGPGSAMSESLISLIEGSAPETAQCCRITPDIALKLN